LANRLYADGSAVGSPFRLGGSEFTIAGVVAAVATKPKSQVSGLKLHRPESLEELAAGDEAK
jgi:hypothetical protein